MRASADADRRERLGGSRAGRERERAARGQRSRIGRAVLDGIGRDEDRDSRSVGSAACARASGAGSAGGRIAIAGKMTGVPPSAAIFCANRRGLPRRPRDEDAEPGERAGRPHGRRQRVNHCRKDSGPQSAVCGGHECGQLATSRAAPRARKSVGKRAARARRPRARRRPPPTARRASPRRRRGSRAGRAATARRARNIACAASGVWQLPDKRARERALGGRRERRRRGRRAARARR